MIEREIALSYEDRIRRAKYLGALADRVFRKECVRLGLDVGEAIKSPISSIVARQCGVAIELRQSMKRPPAEGRDDIACWPQ